MIAFSNGIFCTPKMEEFHEEDFGNKCQSFCCPCPGST